MPFVPVMLLTKTRLGTLCALHFSVDVNLEYNTSPPSNPNAVDLTTLRAWNVRARRALPLLKTTMNP
ncbi:hypothetical protein MTBBW1_2150004 [Desulfamplus magnetovallimortis]|uniref:Uncharacterized protein n=1 Tax=Desulfamplus magnetovallimortis TaxID=1246637 RepID=A0A1W1HCN5_9BACT|nr:hypothetical protein MTBBW1_2150004 [Desulfamplus magnetovallimortis]